MIHGIVAGAGAASGGGGGGSTTTWDPASHNAGITLSNGNLTASQATGDFDNVKATRVITTGKHYWEVEIDVQGTAGDCFLGVCDSTYNNALRVASANPSAILRSNGTQYKDNSTSGSAFSYTAGDVVMFAWDADGEQIWFGKNGTWHSGGDPAAGTGAQITGLSTASMSPCFGPDNDATTTTVTINCGATAFAYSIPSGFTAL